MCLHLSVYIHIHVRIYPYTSIDIYSHIHVHVYACKYILSYTHMYDCIMLRLQAQGLKPIVQTRTYTALLLVRVPASCYSFWLLAGHDGKYRSEVT